jgi:hypothetical protein
MPTHTSTYIHTYIYIYIYIYIYTHTHTSILIINQNNVFFGVLLLEIFLYACAFGLGGFLNDPWKAFDLVVAVGTTTGYAQQNQRIAQFAKSFRLMRVIRLMRMITPIRYVCIYIYIYIYI